MKKKQKWTAALDIDCWRWVKEMSERTRITGSEILNKLIRREMTNKSGKLEGELEQERVQLELQRITDKKAELAMKEQDLMKRLNEDQTPAPRATSVTSKRG